MNKKQTMLNWLKSEQPNTVPAAFFIHFGPDFRFGQVTVDKHLDFFRSTNMDFVKIQYELPFPLQPEIQTPDDWHKLPVYDADFFKDQLEVTKALVEAMSGEALIVQTLYSPFASCGHATSDAMITEHIKTAPEKAKIGLERAAQGILNFARACIDIGVDGFYASTQGGEAHRFADPAIFGNSIKPYDLMVLNEAMGKTTFNILHICDWHGPYGDLTPFTDYPGDAISASLATPSGDRMTLSELEAIFHRPVMGGVNRHGNIADMTQDEIVAYVQSILADASAHTILGADCTVPGNIDWTSIRTAIDAAHSYLVP